MTEARNPEGEEYGVARMKMLVANCHKQSPDNLIAECLQDLQKFTLGTKPTDDLTLLAIQRGA
jgi:serine phosphatase RsbU (regulator of sigma subunit)